eukprot:11158754-Lingulodinium_polyedra.AAC.1
MLRLRTTHAVRVWGCTGLSANYQQAAAGRRPGAANPLAAKDSGTAGGTLAVEGGANRSLRQR